MPKLNHSLTQPCRKCNGTGQELLSERASYVVKLVKSLRRATRHQIYQRMKADGLISPKVKHSTGLVRVHKYVEKLEDGGLLKRTEIVPKDGNGTRRAWAYEVV